MKKINLLIASLTITLFMLIGITLEKGTSAQTQHLGCSMLNGCDSSATCGSSGTANGCKMNCQDGAIVNCPVKPKGGGEVGGEGGDS